MEIISTVPIRAAYKRYLAHEFEIEPFQVRKSESNLAVYMRHLFSSPYMPGRRKSIDESRFNDSLRICIPADLLNAGRFIISAKHVSELDRYIRKEFEREVSRRLLIAERFAIDHKEMVERFIVEFDLAEFVDCDSLLKQFRRKYGTKKDRGALKTDVLRLHSTIKTG